MTTPQEAARATLAAGSCRIRVTVALDDGGKSWEEGVADLTRRRVEVDVHIDSRGWEKLAEALAERFPWLDDDEDADEEKIVEIDRRVVFDGDTRYVPPHVMVDGTRGPLRIVECLAEMLPTTRRFRIDGVPAVHGEAWTDDEGRLARVVWAENPRYRERRLYTPVRVWHELELWDYGVPVDIEIPEITPGPPFGVRGAIKLARDVRDIVRGYRRRKREWLAKQPD